MRKLSLAVLVLLMVFAAGFAFADVKHKGVAATRDIVLTEDEGDKGEIKGAVLKVEELNNDKSDFNLTLSSNRSAEGDVFAIGEKLEIIFKSDKDCYLTILDFTPSGNILVLFPNKWVPSGKVAAGQEIRIPQPGQKFSFKIGGPAGTDIVKAIATNNETKVFDDANKELLGPFSSLKDVRQATRDILLVGDDEEEKPATQSQEPLKWNAASLAVHTKGDDPAAGGFGVAKNGDWVAKIWTDKGSYLTGNSVYVRVQTNMSAKLVSLVNKGTSGGENLLIPANYERELKPGDISVLPGKDDKWKLVVTAPDGLDEVIATLKQSNGAEIQVALKVKIEKD